MIKVSEIAFSVYPVADFARARAFYEGVFGLKPSMLECPEGNSEAGGPQWVEYEIAGGVLALGKAPGWEPSVSGGSVAFEVEDVDQAAAIVQEHGATILMGPFDSPVCRMVIIKDPEGNALTIHRRNPQPPAKA